MKNLLLITLGFGMAIIFGFYPQLGTKENVEKSVSSSNQTLTTKEERMKLGAFSISLSVKNIEASQQFYEKLGFTKLAGDLDKKYLIMKNENALIGLFEGMFENNLLTFNPGWDEDGKNTEDFHDIREIQSHLKKAGIQIDNEIDANTSGPASLVITDPDGNVILLDQHR